MPYTFPGSFKDHPNFLFKTEQEIQKILEESLNNDTAKPGDCYFSLTADDDLKFWYFKQSFCEEPKGIKCCSQTFTAEEVSRRFQNDPQVMINGLKIIFASDLDWTLTEFHSEFNKDKFPKGFTPQIIDDIFKQAEPDNKQKIFDTYLKFHKNFLKDNIYLSDFHPALLEQLANSDNVVVTLATFCDYQNYVQLFLTFLAKSHGGNSDWKEIFFDLQCNGFFEKYELVGASAEKLKKQESVIDVIEYCLMDDDKKNTQSFEKCGGTVFWVDREKNRYEHIHQIQRRFPKIKFVKELPQQLGAELNQESKAETYSLVGRQLFSDMKAEKVCETTTKVEDVEWRRKSQPEETDEIYEKIESPCKRRIAEVSSTTPQTPEDSVPESDVSFDGAKPLTFS